MGVLLSKPNTFKNSWDGGDANITSTSFGLSAMQGWRKKMEDAHLAFPGVSDEVDLYGVFDGHGGPAVAHWACLHFATALNNNVKELDCLQEKIQCFDNMAETENTEADKSGKEENIALANKAKEKKPKNESYDCPGQWRVQSFKEEMSLNTFAVPHKVVVFCEALQKTFLDLDRMLLQEDYRKELAQIHLQQEKLNCEQETPFRDSRQSPKYQKTNDDSSEPSTVNSRVADIIEDYLENARNDNTLDAQIVRLVQRGGVRNLNLLSLAAGDDHLAELSCVNKNKDESPMVDNATDIPLKECVEIESKSTDSYCSGSNTTPEQTNCQQNLVGELTCVGDPPPVADGREKDVTAGTSEDSNFTAEKTDEAESDSIENDNSNNNQSTADDKHGNKDRKSTNAMSALLSRAAFFTRLNSTNNDGNKSSPQISTSSNNQNLRGNLTPSIDTLKPQPHEPELCGAAAILAAICICHGEPYLVTANAGDSRAVLCREGVAIALSKDHKPELTDERRRIAYAGGTVLCGRVDGNLNLSRSLGDLMYKSNACLYPEDQKITSLPDIRVIPITGKDEFVILACDGIWDCMGNQQIVDFVRSRLLSSEERANSENSSRGDVSGSVDSSAQLSEWFSLESVTSAKTTAKAPQKTKVKISEICEEICDKCIASRPGENGIGVGCDNMTVLIVKFNKRIREIGQGVTKHRYFRGPRIYNGYLYRSLNPLNP